MNNKEQKEKVTELLLATGHAHHQAYIETDGVDPEWAIWYGEYLEGPLSKMLDTNFSATEITEKLIGLNKEFNSRSPSEHWTKYYADKLVDRKG